MPVFFPMSAAYLRPSPGTLGGVARKRRSALLDPADEVRRLLEPLVRGILLVVDEPEARTLARLVLDRHDYSVIEARHGDEALDLCNSFYGNIDLMVSDVVNAANGRKTYFGSLAHPSLTSWWCQKLVGPWLSSRLA